MRSLTKALRYKRHIIDPALFLGLELIGFLCLCYATYSSMTNLFIMLCFKPLLGFSIVAGNHRLLSHNSWPCPRWLRNAISLLSTLALQGAPLAWVAVHREHHHKTDLENDPHSPLFKSRIWIQFLSLQYIPNLTYATDMWKDPWQKFLFDYYWVINFSFFAFLLFINPFYLVLWLGIVFLAQMAAFIVNTTGHDTPWYWFPTKERIPGDTSRNVWLLALFTGGESWHLNHHKEPWKWFYGRKWWQLDYTGMEIFLIILLTNPSYFFKTHRNSKG